MSQPPYQPPPYQPPYQQPGAQGGQTPGGQRPRKSSSSTIIFVVLGMAGFGLLMFGGLAFYGFNRYMERARAADSSVGHDPGTSARGRVNQLDSTDGHSKLLLPPRWKSLPDLTDKGVLRAGNHADEEYVLVLTEEKVDFAVQADLSKYGEIVTGNMRQELMNPEIGQPKALTIGGRKALQYEVHGAVDLLNIAYLITVIDGAERYHQVIVWTKESKFKRARPALERTVSSFREL
jgi:hypothetical protein